MSSDAAAPGSVPVGGGRRTKLKRCLWCRGRIDRQLILDKRDRQILHNVKKYKAASVQQQKDYEERYFSHLGMSLDRSEKVFLAPPQNPEPPDEDEVAAVEAGMRDGNFRATMTHFQVCMNEQAPTFFEAMLLGMVREPSWAYECWQEKQADDGTK